MPLPEGNLGAEGTIEERVDRERVALAGLVGHLGGRLIDVDDVCGRLYKIGDSSVRPEVVDLYNKRFKATLIDYLAWVRDATAYSSVGGDRARSAKRADRSDLERAQELRALENTALATSDWAAGLVSIPLRAGKSVFVQNLPLDLTEQEARKIAGVIEALAVDRSVLR